MKDMQIVNSEIYNSNVLKYDCPVLANNCSEQVEGKKEKQLDGFLSDKGLLKILFITCTLLIAELNNLLVFAADNCSQGAILEM